jgi:hypothetical protein
MATLWESVFDSSSEKAVLVCGPVHCGKSSFAFSLAYEHAQKGGCPIFLCHKSQFESSSAVDLPMPVRLGHAPLHSTLFRMEALQRISIKYFTSWKELLSLILTIQHSLPLNNSIDRSSSQNRNEMMFPFTMLVIDDISLVLPNFNQFVIFSALIQNTIIFQLSCQRSSTASLNTDLKVVVVLDVKSFPMQEAAMTTSNPLQIPRYILRYFETNISFVPQDQSFQILQARRCWDSTRGDYAHERHATVLASKCVLLVPRNCDTKILILLPPAVVTSSQSEDTEVPGEHSLQDGSLYHASNESQLGDF